MKTKLLFIITVITLLLFPKIHFGQAPTLGTAANFAMFSTAGAVTSSSTLLYLTHVTGNIGAAPASITGFGNVDGVLYQGGTEFAQASTDIQDAYLVLNGLTPDFTHASPFGAGLILTAGVHNIVNAAIQLNGELILDAQGVPGAEFIFQLDGAFNTATNSKIILINGAQACNVFWKVEGVVTMNPGTIMKGTIIANNSAINMSTGDTLEGRIFAINGAVSVNEVVIYTPEDDSSPVLTGPLPPTLSTTECFALFSSIGPVTDNLSSFVGGDVGTNGSSDLTTGFDPLKVSGAIHPIPDGFTSQAATDLNVAYLYLGALPFDIELMEPTLFGHDLVLTPHTYLLNAAVTFTDTISLNAQGNANAIFVIKVAGAFNAGANSNVKLINGTQAKNVYWLIDGAVDIGVNSVFNGTMIVAGAINLQTAVEFNGRALTINGAVNSASINVVMPTTCASTITSEPNNQIACEGDSVSFVVSATGIGLTYQWRKGVVNLINFGNISGATSDTLTINPVNISDTASNYNVIVSGTYMPNDTSVNASLLISPASSTNNPQEICSGESYPFNGNIYTLAGNYNDTLTSMNGCDSIIVTQVSVVPFYSTNNPQAICDGGSYTYNGNTYTIAGNYNDTLSSISGCDSIIVTQLTVMPLPTAAGTITGIDTICQGQTGVIYFVPAITNATDYIWTLPAGAIITAGMNTNNIAVDFSGIASSGSITVKGTNSCGSGAVSADFVVTANSFPTAAETITGTDTVCQGQTGVIYSVPAITNATGYNWILPLGVIITSGANTNSITVDFIASASSGNITVEGSSSCGNGAVSADFVVIVNPLPIAAIISAGGATTFCIGGSVILSDNNGGIWSNGTTASSSITVNTSGDYFVTTTNTCGSVTSNHIIVTVIPASSTNNPQIICNGGSYVFNGNTYTVAGNYNDTLSSISGCDSIIVTQLSVVPYYSINNPHTICEGSSYIFNGNTYTVEGSYNDTLTSINGCDSIIVTQLSVVPVYSTNNPQAICDGGSYTYNGNTYTIAGNYNDTLPSISGCDSIIVTQLTVNATFSINNPQTINSGESYVINGNTYTEEGNYNDTLNTINGCDSIIITQLSVFDFFIPEGFSPNGDGINDVFVIRGIDRFPNNTFVIFNRWGNKVFETSSYQNTWDGIATIGLRVGEDKLPISTYFYILDLKDGSDIFKGTIYLNR